MKAGAYGDGFHSVNVFFAFRAPRRYSTARAERAQTDPKRNKTMSEAGNSALDSIRAEIDSIDAAMHDLLIRRSAVIDELIAIKGAQTPGTAFRPGREADMMRRFVMRHEGHLPLTTVEHIWREIISTFTAMQAPYAIVAGPAADRQAMRDVVRFYFGFSVPVSDVASSEAALNAISGKRSQIAVIAADSEGVWWRALCGKKAPKILARLPFIILEGRLADLPCYVATAPLNDDWPADTTLYAVRAGNGLAAVADRFGGRLVSRAGTDALIELPATVEPAEFTAELDAAGGEQSSIEAVGGFAAPIEVSQPTGRKEPAKQAGQAAQ
jgi:chorismate mutase